MTWSQFRYLEKHIFLAMKYSKINCLKNTKLLLLRKARKLSTHVHVKQLKYYLALNNGTISHFKYLKRYQKFLQQLFEVITQKGVISQLQESLTLGAWFCAVQLASYQRGP